MPPRWLGPGLGVVLLVASSGPASAEEVVGRRLFSDTLAVSEPFVEDELSLPSLLHIRRPASRALATSIGAEVKKRITSDFELSIAVGLTHLEAGREGTVIGLDNLDVGLKYQFLRSAEHEAVASLALKWDVGGTGRSAVGAESFHSVAPALLLGKGFGDLPAAVRYLQPLAVTGAFGARIPMRDTEPRGLEWGVVLEYSLPYLQSYVRHLGLPTPLDRLMPLVELSGETALDRGAAGRSTGTVNAGAVWVGDATQIGIEAVVPINERSGKNVGVRAFVRFSLEELFGGRFGKPLF